MRFTFWFPVILVAACSPDGAGDGVPSSADCDDANALAYTGATEVCDGVDNDCDGQVDEADATDALTWYADMDGDGFGDPAAPQTACEVPAQHVDNDADCDDDNAAFHPEAAEVCDAADIDEDCDDLADDADPSVDVSTMSTWYADADGDTYGDASSTIDACDLPKGWVDDATDCDDGNKLAWVVAPVSETVVATDDLNLDYIDSERFVRDFIAAYTGPKGDPIDMTGWMTFPLPDGVIELTAATLNLYGHFGPVQNPEVNVHHSTLHGWNSKTVTVAEMTRGPIVSAAVATTFAGPGTWAAFPLDVTAWDPTADLLDGELTLGVDNQAKDYGFVYFNAASAKKGAPELDLTYTACTGSR